MTGLRRQPGALWRLEARLLWRHRVLAVLAALTAGWSGLLLALPAPTARTVAPWLLLLETALAGTTLVGALVILERAQGMRAALGVSPARPAARIAARVGLLAALAVGSAVPKALAARLPAADIAVAVAGVGLVAVPMLLLAMAAAARRRSVLTFTVVLPLWLLPLLLPMLAHGAGLRQPALYAAPTTAAMDLLQGENPPVLALAWLLLATAAAGAFAHRHLTRPVRACPVRTRPVRTRPVRTRPVRTRPVRTCPVRFRLGRRPGKVRREPTAGPVRSFLRADLISIRRDPLLVLIALSPVLLGLALRTGYPPLHGWLLVEYGFDLDPYRPVLLAAAVLIHVPMTFGAVGALLVLDDMDDRALVALRTSPLTVPRYLALRASLVTAGAWSGLAVAVPLTGLAGSPWFQLLPAAAAAGLVAPLFMFAVLALAQNKVEGVAAVKLLGLPIYLPLVAWWLPAPAGWALAVLPTWWPLRAQWDGWGFAVGGAAAAAAGLALLARPVRGRLARL